MFWAKVSNYTGKDTILIGNYSLNSSLSCGVVHIGEYLIGETLPDAICEHGNIDVSWIFHKELWVFEGCIADVGDLNV
jgi:hypothetical protein